MFTNVGSGKVTFLVNKHIDNDLLWGFAHSDDRVGVDFAVRCYPAVYAQDGSIAHLSLLSTFIRDPLLDPRYSQMLWIRI